MRGQGAAADPMRLAAALRGLQAALNTDEAVLAGGIADGLTKLLLRFSTDERKSLPVVQKMLEAAAAARRHPAAHAEPTPPPWATAACGAHAALRGANA